MWVTCLSVVANATYNLQPIHEILDGVLNKSFPRRYDCKGETVVARSGQQDEDQLGNSGWVGYSWGRQCCTLTQLVWENADSLTLCDVVKRRSGYPYFCI